MATATTSQSQPDTLPPSTSTGQRIWKRFRKHKLAIVGAVILGIMYLMALCADFIGPYPETWADRNQSYAPPTPIYMVSPEGGITWPYVFPMAEKFNPETLLSEYQADTSRPSPIKLFHRGEPYKILGLIDSDIHLFGVDAPARIYLFGADIQGRDVFSRLLFGARISLTVGIVAILIAYPIGMLVGGIAGYFGGLVDNILMRLVEAVLAFPSFFLLLALAATLPPGIPSQLRYLMIIGILSFIGWAGLARVIRGMVLSIKQQEYVEAAKAVGASDLSIIVRHILPQTSSWIIISATLAIPLYTLGEASLSFLTLGIQDPYASWGNMLQEARSYSSILKHPWLLVSGFAIVISVMAFNFLGDGLRDAFDAKKQI